MSKTPVGDPGPRELQRHAVKRFLEGFEAVQALRRGDVALGCLVPGYRPQLATRGDRARAVAAAMVTLAAGLNKAA